MTLSDQPIEEAMVIGGEGGFEAETSTMEVDQDGEVLVVGLVEFWEVETSGRTRNLSLEGSFINFFFVCIKSKIVMYNTS